MASVLEQCHRETKLLNKVLQQNHKPFSLTEETQHPDAAKSPGISKTQTETTTTIQPTTTFNGSASMTTQFEKAFDDLNIHHETPPPPTSVNKRLSHDTGLVSKNTAAAQGRSPVAADAVVADDSLRASQSSSFTISSLSSISSSTSSSSDEVITTNPTGSSAGDQNNAPKTIAANDFKMISITAAPTENRAISQNSTMRASSSTSQASSEHQLIEKVSKAPPRRSIAFTASTKKGSPIACSPCSARKATPPPTVINNSSSDAAPSAGRRHETVSIVDEQQQDPNNKKFIISTPLRVLASAHPKSSVLSSPHGNTSNYNIYTNINSGSSADAEAAAAGGGRDGSLIMDRLEYGETLFDKCKHGGYNLAPISEDELQQRVAAYQHRQRLLRIVFWIVLIVVLFALFVASVALSVYLIESHFRSHDEKLMMGGFGNQLIGGGGGGGVSSPDALRLRTPNKDAEPAASDNND